MRWMGPKEEVHRKRIMVQFTHYLANTYGLNLTGLFYVVIQNATIISSYVFFSSSRIPRIWTPIFQEFARYVKEGHKYTKMIINLLVEIDLTFEMKHFGTTHALFELYRKLFEAVLNVWHIFIALSLTLLKWISNRHRKWPAKAWIWRQSIKCVLDFSKCGTIVDRNDRECDDRL